MARFRGTDQAIEREIAALEGIARVRLRRTVEEMRELERDLRELKKERARRRAEHEVATTTSSSAEAETAG